MARIIAPLVISLCKRQFKILSSISSKTLMSVAKLNPAIEALIKTFEEKRGGEESELLNLISGIVACSIPGALKECCTGKEDLEEAAFR